MNVPVPTLPRHSRKTPAGMALLLCLLLLTSLTLLGLSAASETVMQGKLADNLREAHQARQAALAAQDWAEDWLLGLPGPAPETCSPPCPGLVLHASNTLPPNPETLDLSWWLANGHIAGTDPLDSESVAAAGVDGARPSVWVIEAVHQAAIADDDIVEAQAWYRILARGAGQAGTGVAVVESIVTRPWPVASDPAVVATGPCDELDATAKCGRYAWRALR